MSEPTSTARRSGLRRRVAWWVRGDTYAEVIDEQAAAIRELQHRVAELITIVAGLQRDGVSSDELRTVADDVNARLAALSDRLADRG